MKNSALVLFGSTRWSRTDALDAALDSEHQVIVPDLEWASLSDSYKDRVQSVQLSAFPTDPELDAAAATLDREFVDRWSAIGLDDYTSVVAARLDERGTGRIFPASAAEAVLEKPNLRDLWNDYCGSSSGAVAPCDHYRIDFGNFQPGAAEIGDALRTIKDWSTPLVLKPAALDASVGVTRVDSLETATEAISTLLSYLGDNIDYATSQGVHLAPHLTIEREIMRGPFGASGEFSAEVSSVRGHHRLMGVTDKTIDPQTFIELGHQFPSTAIPTKIVTAVESAVDSLLTKLGVKTAISHWEFIATPDGRICVVEAQLRPPGDNICDLIAYAAGRNPYTLLANNPFEWLPEAEINAPTRVARIAYLYPETPLKRIQQVLVEPIGTRQRTVIDESGILESESWKGPLKWNEKFISVMGWGDDADEAERELLDCAGKVLLIGVDEGDDQRSTGMTVKPANE